MAAFQRITGLLKHQVTVSKVAACAASKWNCSARSCLYVSGKYGTNITATVIPDLNIEKDLESCNFEENLSARKMPTANIDLKALAGSAKYLAWIDSEDSRLESRRKEISAAILTLSEDSAERAQLVAESREVKQALKAVTQYRWDLDDQSVLTYLHLPNKLSQNTPLEDDRQVTYHITELESLGHCGHGYKKVIYVAIPTG